MRNRLILLCLLCGLVAPATAQVSIGIGLPNVSIGINLQTYPQLVRVPDYPVYYAPQLRSNYFFYDGLYWIYQDDRWYASAWFNGPWGRVAPEVLAVYLLRVPVRYYRRPPEHFRGRQDLSVLWFRFDAYEQDLPWLQVGQSVELTVPTAPEQVLSGPITFIEPFVNETTRTAKDRVDVTNPPVEINGVKQRALRQQQYAEGRVRAETPPRLVIPSTAVLFPGGQAYAYVDKGDGLYEVRQLKLGRRGDQHCEVLAGLDEGEQVVTTGNVLIDAQPQFNRGASGEANTGESVAETAMVAHDADDALAAGSAPAPQVPSLSQTPFEFIS